MRWLMLPFVGILLLITSGCASVMNGGDWPVRITAVPMFSDVTVTNLRSGQPIIQAQTPFIASLERGAGYFKPAKYQVTIGKEGYKSQSFVLNGRLDGWYFGNIIAGGLIGMLLIDPLTGDMYVLPKYVHAVLQKKEIPRADAEKRGPLVLYMPTDMQALSESVRKGMRPVGR